MAYIIAIGFIGIRFVDSFLCVVSVLTPEMERRMEKTIGMRIKECRLAMGMTQEELAEKMYMPSCFLSVSMKTIKKPPYEAQC